MLTHIHFVFQKVFGVVANFCYNSTYHVLLSWWPAIFDYPALPTMQCQLFVLLYNTVQYCTMSTCHVGMIKGCTYCEVCQGACYYSWSLWVRYCTVLNMAVEWTLILSYIDVIKKRITYSGYLCIHHSRGTIHHLVWKGTTVLIIDLMRHCSIWQ